MVPLRGLLYLPVVVGCAGPVAPPQPARRDLAVVHALPAGTVVRLLPVELVAPAADVDVAVLTGLLREALRQSVRIDIAHGLEDTAADWAITCHLDPAAGSLTSTLTATEAAPPIALAAAEFDPDRPAATADALALATRIALGEDAAAMPTVPIGLGYSASTASVRDTEAALAAIADDDLRRAAELLEAARRADAGSTVAMLVAAELALRGSDAETAARAAQQGLQLGRRLLPTTAHRLARTVLLASASSAGAAEAAALDRKLLALGEACAAERPHDPHGCWTRAQAHNLLGAFAQAEPDLAALRRRWPKVGAVAYHHAFACIALGRTDQALAAVEAARSLLPPLQVVVPRSLAMHAAGRDAELDAWLGDLAGRRDLQQSPLLHHLRRMRASLAIARGQSSEAAGLLLADLEWLRQRSSQLQLYADDVAQTGHVLVLLGRAEDTFRAVGAFDQLPHLPESMRTALTFLGGLCTVTREGQRAKAAEASLSRGGESSWTRVLRAAAHRQRGELADETRELLQAVQQDRNPLLRAALIRALRAAGETEQARTLAAALGAELTTLDLRRLHRHPLVDPAAALTLLVCR